MSQDLRSFRPEEPFPPIFLDALAPYRTSDPAFCAEQEAIWREAERVGGCDDILAFLDQGGVGMVADAAHRAKGGPDPTTQ